MTHRVLLFAVVAGLLSTACDRFPLSDVLKLERGESQEKEERKDRRQLRNMRAAIDEMADGAECEDVEDCRFIGLGAKPCGGPWEYLVYSTTQTDAAALAEKVAEYNRFEDNMNSKYGYASDCSLPAEPRLACVEGRCVDLNRVDAIVKPSDEPQEPPQSEPPSMLRLVDAPDALPKSDPYRLQEVQLDGDVLSVVLSHSGGCAAHDYALWATPVTLRSEPPQKVLALTHDGHGDMCEALITQEVHFDLTLLRKIHPELERLVVRLENWDQQFEYVF